MATFKTLAEAYDHAEENFLEPRHLHMCEYFDLVDLLNAYDFTRAQLTVAVANVYEGEVDDEHTSALCVLKQTDDGFDWEYVGYVEYRYDYDEGEVNIAKA